MKLIKRMHPILWLNSIFASPYFIIGVNIIVMACFIFAHFSVNKETDHEKIDLGISWWTMGMDQVIISAGWLIYKKQRKDTQGIHKKLDELLEKKKDRRKK